MWKDDDVSHMRTTVTVMITHWCHESSQTYPKSLRTSSTSSLLYKHEKELSLIRTFFWFQWLLEISVVLCADIWIVWGFQTDASRAIQFNWYFRFCFVLCKWNFSISHLFVVIRISIIIYINHLRLSHCQLPTIERDFGYEQSNAFSCALLK